MEPLALTIHEAAKSAGQSRAKLYEDIKKGLLRAVKNGRSTRILIDDLKRYLSALPAIEPKAETVTLEEQSGTSELRRPRGGIAAKAELAK
jgi:excisionase family DNA binding protein